MNMWITKHKTREIESGHHVSMRKHREKKVFAICDKRGKVISLLPLRT